MNEQLFNYTYERWDQEALTKAREESLRRLRLLVRARKALLECFETHPVIKAIEKEIRRT